MGNMGKQMSFSALSAIVGCLIGSIIYGVILQLGWNPSTQMQIVVYGYGALTTIIVWFVTTTSKLKEKEKSEIYAAIAKKADADDLINLAKVIDKIDKKLDGIITFLIEKK